MFIWNPSVVKLRSIVPTADTENQHVEVHSIRITDDLPSVQELCMLIEGSVCPCCSFALTASYDTDTSSRRIVVCQNVLA